jgi:hypothetical protein
VPALDRSALIVADEPPRVERFIAPLRRANLSIVRAEHAWDAEREIRQTPFDLVVVALPVLGVERMLKSLRSEQAAARKAGLIVIGAGEEIEPNDLAVGRLANRLLAGGCSVVEFNEQVTALLDVAPRVEVSDGARLQVTLPAGDKLELWLENLSRSGMLMRALEALPVGSDFGFALEFESQQEPIRGRARVVRHTDPNPLGHLGIAARFLALGGEAPQRLEEFVDRTRTRAPVGEATPPVRAPLSGSKPLPTESRLPTVADAADPATVTRCRDELADLTPVLDEMLERGLTRRLAVADWYITGAELGLESLRAFSSILSSIYESRTISAAAERRLADLVEVRRQLLEFGRPQQDVATRVRIMLELRPALHRLIRELDETGAVAATGPTAARFPGIVSQTAVEIKRLVGAHRGMGNLLALLTDLRRPRLFSLSGGARRSAQQIHKEYGALATSLGVPFTLELLRSRRGLRETTRAVEQEVRNLARRLAAIHSKAYSGRLRSRAGDDLEADLEEAKLHQVLVDTLAAGAEYLARSYAAYRHALEVVGADPTLIDRIERLAATILAADRAAELRSMPLAATSLAERAS